MGQNELPRPSSEAVATVTLPIPAPVAHADNSDPTSLYSHLIGPMSTALPADPSPLIPRITVRRSVQRRTGPSTNSPVSLRKSSGDTTATQTFSLSCPYRSRCRALHPYLCWCFTPIPVPHPLPSTCPHAHSPPSSDPYLPFRTDPHRTQPRCLPCPPCNSGLLHQSIRQTPLSHRRFAAACKAHGLGACVGPGLGAIPLPSLCIPVCL